EHHPRSRRPPSTQRSRDRLISPPLHPPASLTLPAPARIGEVRVLRRQQPHTGVFTDLTDVLCLHLEYPRFSVIQHSAEDDTRIPRPSQRFGCVRPPSQERPRLLPLAVRRRADLRADATRRPGTSGTRGQAADEAPL